MTRAMIVLGIDLTSVDLCEIFRDFSLAQAPSSDSMSTVTSSAAAAY